MVQFEFCIVTPVISSLTSMKFLFIFLQMLLCLERGVQRGSAKYYKFFGSISEPHVAPENLTLK